MHNASILKAKFLKKRQRTVFYAVFPLPSDLSKVIMRSLFQHRRINSLKRVSTTFYTLVLFSLQVLVYNVNKPILKLFPLWLMGLRFTFKSTSVLCTLVETDEFFSFENSNRPHSAKQFLFIILFM